MRSSQTKNGTQGCLDISLVGQRLVWTKQTVGTVRSALTLAVLCALLLIAARQAHSQSEIVLYNFTGSDGANPQSHLISDGAGNFYGTTYGGGAFGSGTVFKLSPKHTGGWKETVLHSFNGGLGQGADGAGPSGPVIFDSAKNLFGTTR